MLSEAKILTENNIFFNAHKIECFGIVGDRVSIKWTNNNKNWSAKGRINKINKKSIKVELLEKSNCIEGSYYPSGTIITVPTTLSSRWSRNNTVLPLYGGY